MGIFSKHIPVTDADDATLVMLVLGGDREAFGQIVSRYQNLLCSLAYSSVGDIKHSEDIAQETFVDAWKKLSSLRQPEKLKSWLCGMLRFKVSHYRRKEVNQPVAGADDLDNHDIKDTEQGQLETLAIKEQQQALLWRTLDEIDETYRETLVLYYREQQSIEQVAAELDITPDAAKQRLSRGRKLLQKAMTSFVEEALESTKPGALFTAAVLTTINTLAPTKAAAMGAGATKTSSMFGIGTAITLLASVSGLISSYFGLRAGLAQSRTQNERRETIRMVALFLGTALAFVVGVMTLRYLAIQSTGNATLHTWASQAVVIGFVIAYLVMTKRLFERSKSIRAQERKASPDAFARPQDQIGAKQREYVSAFKLFGVPLIHVRLATSEQGDKPIFGWIAGGDNARGLLFAWGGVAVAPVAVGIVSVGIISIGAIGVGLLGLGTVGIGLIAFGASAIGYKAYSSMSSLGWESAFSDGFSIAVDAAIGPIAFANEVNNEVAAEIVKFSLFTDSYLWVLAGISVLVIVPAAWYSRSVKKTMG